MKARLLLGEHATIHPDGTFSVLRAGINAIRGATLPISFDGTLVARIEGDLADEGEHRFDLKCMDQDGAAVLPPLQGQFSFPQGGGFHAIMLGVVVKYPRAGPYHFVLRVDQVELDRWMINVVEVPKKGPA